MQWEWVVPVIAVVLWIISSVIRAPEEPPRDVRRRRLPMGEQPAEPAKPPSEVDRFLEEINKLRQRAAEEPKTVIPANPEPPKRPRPPDAPRPIPRRPRPIDPPPPRRPMVETLPPKVVVERPVGTLAPAVPLPPPPVPVVVAPVIEVVAAVPASARSGQRSPPAGAPSIGASVPITQLLALLHSPKAAQAAILLNEVLGPPRSRRHRK
ncbi:MAG: hypothetical protein K2R98_17715 [Gemmataceae bacterium]|nr:hypothetical protein [Gemmataceae bacterium]